MIIENYWEILRKFRTLFIKQVEGDWWTFISENISILINEISFVSNAEMYDF